MSFPEYLRGRISEDYKNILIQKLEEVRSHTEALKSSFAPALEQANQSLQEAMQREVARLQENLDSELNNSRAKLAEDVNASIEAYSNSWYYADVDQYQQQLEMLIADVISNVPPPPPPPVKEHEELASVCELMVKLDHGNTQSEILNIVLQHISGWVDRAVLFVVKGEQASGWAALGLGPDWDVNRIRQIKVDLGNDTVLRHVAETGQAAYGPAEQFPDNSELFGLIGPSFPSLALAFPIMVRGKIAGILYADTSADPASKPDLPNLLYLASRSAGLSIDLLPLKPKPAPGAPAPVIVQPPARPVSAAPATVAAAVAEAAESTSAQEAEAAEGTVMMPAIQPSMPPVVVSEEDQKLHDDARRFARLLVSEIKLYNEAQVSAGRENRDIYDRLRDDIERSRRAYTERVPVNIQNQSNYFYEELVRTLANGDPSLLGM